MENKKTNNKKTLIAVAVMAVVIAAMLIVWKVATPTAGAGSKAITLEVVDNTGAVTSYDVTTEAEYLAEVFEEVDGLTVEGDVSDYGLYINTVNGVTADYNVDGSYWSIMVNDEYGQYGADAQPVTDGDKYGLVYTK
ncbi:MAG: DUF4430 domain-containing protein [Pseudobutyrivibrio sp.]|nr:DUF4430 domain-containing protein [Pseudobutyrivibrio sp.]MCF0186992.1 DUF4430 domain-containing protein [Bacteroidaceae bacterium]